MGEASSINTKVSVPGKGGGRFHKMLTFETVCNWIRLQGFDDYTTQGLIDLASRYPTQAFPSFRRNFNLMIERVRQKRKQELRGQKAEDTEKGTGDGEEEVGQG